MPIPTEPIGSIPRSPELIAGMQQFAIGRISRDQLARLQDEGVRDTIKRFEATESPVITDGEQAKPSFATYPIHGLTNLAPGGVTIPFADGHTRQLPRLTAGPFRYQTYADAYLTGARTHAHVPVKQAVIAASALSLLYPEDGIKGYPREAFLQDLVREAETDIRRCLAQGAHVVQLDFTEGRLALKVTNFYIQCASEPDRGKALRLMKQHVKPGQRVFVGVIDPIDPRVETPEEVRDRVLEAAEYIPLDRLGTTDDCGFAPFSDDTSTDRETAFAKIRARVAGTAQAARALGA